MQTALVAVWKGEYHCNNGRQKTRLELSIEPGQTDDKIDAVFAFQTYEGPIADGALRMSGDLPTSGDLISLQPTDWIKHPDGYSTVGLEARLVDNQSLLRGSILVSGCSEFVLSRVDSPDSSLARDGSAERAKAATKPAEQAISDIPLPTIEPLAPPKSINGEFERKNVRIGDYHATYQLIAANGCGFPVDIDIRSADEQAFANGHPQALASEIGAYVQSYCVNVPAIRVSGFAGQDKVFEGDLTKADRWQIRSTLTPLDIARSYPGVCPLPRVRRQQSPDRDRRDSWIGASRDYARRVARTCRSHHGTGTFRQARHGRDH